MQISVFVPVKTSHSTGCRLGWPMVGTSHHPAACTGKHWDELLSMCVAEEPRWASGFHIPLPTVWLLSPEEKKEFWKEGIWAICTMSVPLTSPKTTGAADSIPLLLGLYSGFPFSNGIMAEIGTRSGLSLGFSICSSSLMWQQCWLGSRDHLLVREGMSGNCVQFWAPHS